MAQTSRGHRTLPHTADVILEAWGPDLASCCEEALSALVALYVEVGSAAAVDERAVHLGPGLAEALLLGALEEVIFMLDTAAGVPVGAVVRQAADGGLDLRVRLADPAAVTASGAVPKAVSRSDLEVAARDGGMRCRFLVDV